MLAAGSQTQEHDNCGFSAFRFSATSDFGPSCEPQLAPFDSSKVKPISYEAEIRTAIAKLKTEKEPQAKKANEK